jgi:hypothetical protein
MPPQGTSVQTNFRVSGRTIELFATQPGATSAQRAIQQGRRLKFYIHGVDYSPTPIGSAVNNNPLGSGNSAVWMRDFPLMRAIGVNAIHVYNVDANVSGPIDNALAAAWNNGVKPIYVVISIFFPADCLNNVGCANDLAGQYYNLDKTYGPKPAILGVAISN